jgi:hypothetical protein
VIVDFLVQVFSPSSVIDIGSSTGLFLRNFQDHNISDIVGVDGPWVPSDQLKIPASKFIAHDLTKPINLNRKFDLLICLEVLEHVSLETGNLLIEEMSELSDVVVFSAAVPGQGGTHHINEQWPIYWATKFVNKGYKIIDPRTVLWDKPEILPWYKQNMLFFTRRDIKNLHIFGENGNSSKMPLSMIHPEMTYAGLLDVEINGIMKLLIKLETLLNRLSRTILVEKKYKSN